MLDLNKLEKMLYEPLKKETSESLTKWMILHTKTIIDIPAPTDIIILSIGENFTDKKGNISV